MEHLIKWEKVTLFEKKRTMEVSNNVNGLLLTIVAFNRQEWQIQNSFNFCHKRWKCYAASKSQSAVKMAWCGGE